MLSPNPPKCCISTSTREQPLTAEEILKVTQNDAWRCDHFSGAENQDASLLPAFWFRVQWGFFSGLWLMCRSTRCRWFFPRPGVRFRVFKMPSMLQTPSTGHSPKRSNPKTRSTRLYDTAIPPGLPSAQMAHGTFRSDG